jgi:hypothetical protein
MDRTVGPREGLAAGIIALGVLAIAMPFVVAQIPSVTADRAAFALAGMSILIGLFVVAAGVLSFLIRD